MARVDVQAYPSVAPTGAPGNDYESIPSSPAMFGGLIGQAEEKLGSGIENVGETGLQTLTARQDLQNEIHQTSLVSWAADNTTDSYTRFSQLQGKAALDAYPAYKEELERIKTQALSRAPSLKEQAQLGRSLQTMQDYYSKLGAYHSNREFTTYANKTATDQKQSFAAQAMVAATEDNGPEDAQHMNQALYASDDAVRKYGEQSHWDQDMTDQEVRKNRGANVKNIVEALIADNSLDKAAMIFTANRDNIDAVSAKDIFRALHAPMKNREVMTAASIATGQPIDPQHFDWTERAAKVPPGYVSRVMQAESSTGAEADRPGSQYKGLAQFGTEGRQRYGITDPYSVGQNASALIREAEENTPALTRALGRPPNAAEIYLAHQQGVGGAVAQLQNPDRPAWQNMLSTAEGRAKGAEWAKAAIWGNMPESAKGAFGSVENVTGADFVRTVKGFYGAGGARTPVESGAVIDRPEAYRRAQAMFGSNPTFLRQVESAIDHQWGEQRKVNEERIAEIQSAMQNIVPAIADGHVEAEKDVPADLGLLGAKQAAHWQEHIAAAKILGARVAQLPMATPEAVRVLRDDLAAGLGESGPLYKFQKDAVAAFDKKVSERKKNLREDPATYVLRNDAELKTMFDAAEKAGTPAALQAFGDKMIARQDYLGVPPDQRRILPAQDTEELAQRWRDPARLPPPKPGESGGAQTVIAEMQGTARLWGDHWPDVYREIAPKLDPVLRAVAVGGEPAALTRLLNDKPLSIGKILASEDDTKDSELKKDVVDALKPFAKTVSGTERSQTLSDYVDVVHRLAARYVSEGTNPVTAATQAVKDLLGYNYDFVDESQAHFRVPKRNADGSAMPFSAEEISRGAEAARHDLGSGEFKLASKTDSASRGLSDAYLAEETPERVRSQGVWVTSPDEKGLVMFQPNGFAVRRADGQPLSLSWADLGERGRAALHDTNALIGVPGVTSTEEIATAAPDRSGNPFVGARAAALAGGGPPVRATAPAARAPAAKPPDRVTADGKEYDKGPDGKYHERVPAAPTVAPAAPLHRMARNPAGPPLAPGPRANPVAPDWRRQIAD